MGQGERNTQERKNTVKFYVAGKWNDRGKVQAVQKILIARGHRITVDWTR